MANQALIAWVTLSEHQVLTDARRGSKEAVQELIRRHEPLLRMVIRRRLARRCWSVVEIEDVLQDIRLVFLSRTVRADAFASSESFLRYLLRTAANKALQMQRHWLNGKRRTLNRETAQLTWDPIDGHASDWIDKELTEEAVETFFRLPEPLNVIYFMRLQKGTAIQIATNLGMSVCQVYRALVTAEKRLRENIQTM